MRPGVRDCVVEQGLRSIEAIGGHQHIARRVEVVGIGCLLAQQAAADECALRQRGGNTRRLACAACLVREAHEEQPLGRRAALDPPAETLEQFGGDARCGGLDPRHPEKVSLES